MVARKKRAAAAAPDPEPASERDPDNGQFLPGNRFWEARSSAGRKPKFETPEALWSACLEYFEWNDKNHLYADTILAFQGRGTHIATAKSRVMSIEALCMFIDVTDRQWREWRTERPDLLPVVEEAERVIKRQKWEGVNAGFFPANIIARDLGLADRTELTGKDGGPVETKSLSDLELARRLAFLLTEGIEE